MDKKKLSDQEFTKSAAGCYNTDKDDTGVSSELITEKKKEGLGRMEVENMAELLDRIKHYDIPPHVAKQLGLGKDWKNNVSQEFLQQVLNSVNQYKNVLKKLSDK